MQSQGYFNCIFWLFHVEMQAEGRWIFLYLALKVPKTVMGQIGPQGVSITDNTLIQAQCNVLMRLCLLEVELLSFLPDTRPGNETFPFLKTIL